MDQVKIGKFISQKRKEKNITQNELAEKLCISNRAISKWENGFCLPDITNMLELCNIFDITINDLLSGEIVKVNNREKKLEENLIELIKQKEKTDKELLTIEIFIGIIVSIILLICIFISSFADIENYLRILLIIMGIIPFTIGICYAIRIEQIAGYYKCNNCHYKYIPTYRSVFFATHINRERKMRCPKCNQKTWHKKVLNNQED